MGGVRWKTAGITAVPERERNKMRKRLRRYGKRLRNRLPLAERWFWRLWTRAGMRLKADRSNEPIGFYIPDVVNRRWFYIIEIDEPHHLQPAQAAKDAQKDQYYRKMGFGVFRIPAYDEEAFVRTLAAVLRLRQENRGHRLANAKARIQNRRTRRILAFQAGAPARVAAWKAKQEAKALANDRPTPQSPERNLDQPGANGKAPGRRIYPTFGRRT